MGDGIQPEVREKISALRWCEISGWVIRNSPARSRNRIPVSGGG
jgi:hypothetical protein